MDQTTNYNLKKPGSADYYDIQDSNDNMDLIDGALKANADEITQHKDNIIPRVEKLEQNVQHNISSWDEVQEIVRRGLAATVFQVGDQLVGSYDGVETVWDVIGIDHDTPTDGALTHSLTIQAHDCIMNCQFDAPEPTNPDTNRQQYGNNRYIHSAIKQWLNSDEAAFNWVSKHTYDAAPTSAPYTGPGYLYNLDPELVAVLGAVNKQVAKATVDGEGQDTFSDKVFLLSRVEVFGTTEGTVTGESPYAFYEGLAGAAMDGDLAGRIKYLSNAARYWWLRSPYVGNSYIPRGVHTAGNINSSHADYAGGLAPACCIV